MKVAFKIKELKAALGRLALPRVTDRENRGKIVTLRARRHASDVHPHGRLIVERVADDVQIKETMIAMVDEDGSIDVDLVDLLNTIKVSGGDIGSITTRSDNHEFFALSIDGSDFMVSYASTLGNPRAHDSLSPFGLPFDELFADDPAMHETKILIPRTALKLLLMRTLPIVAPSRTKSKGWTYFAEFELEAEPSHAPSNNDIDGALIVRATDTIRLAVAREQYRGRNVDFKCLFPCSALATAFKSLSNLNGDVSIGCAKRKLVTLDGSDRFLHRVTIAFDNLTITAVHNQSEFYDVQSLLSYESTASFRIEVKGSELREALSKVSAFAFKQPSKAVEFNFDAHAHDRFELKVFSAQRALLASTHVPCSIDGDATNIRFNAKLLTDMLRAIDWEQLVIAGRDAKSPLFIGVRNDDVFNGLIMPIVSKV